MKKMAYLVLSASLAIFFANCGAAREQIWTQSITEHEGVFQEVTSTDEPPVGFADVVIRASLKTHLPGEGPLFESKYSPHGGPAYSFVLNIDGQAVTWKVPGQRENIPVVSDRHSPDEGDGMKYTLEKKIRLRAGAYQILFEVPQEDYSKTVTVNLLEDTSSTLTFRPLYPRYKWGHPAFQLGFLGFNARLDNAAID